MRLLAADELEIRAELELAELLVSSPAFAWFRGRLRDQVRHRTRDAIHHATENREYAAGRASGMVEALELADRELARLRKAAGV